MYTQKNVAATNRVDLRIASKAQILDALYGRLLRDIEEAAALIRARDYEGKGKAINHADLILTELQVALDFDSAPALCRNLVSLYTYVEQRLHHANYMLDLEALENASEVIRNLRDSFREASAPMRGSSILAPVAFEILGATLETDVLEY